MYGPGMTIMCLCANLQIMINNYNSSMFSEALMILWIFAVMSARMHWDHSHEHLRPECTWTTVMSTCVQNALGQQSWTPKCTGTTVMSTCVQNALGPQSWALVSRMHWDHSHEHLRPEWTGTTVMSTCVQNALGPQSWALVSRMHWDHSHEHLCPECTGTTVMSTCVQHLVMRPGYSINTACIEQQ